MSDRSATAGRSIIARVAAGYGKVAAVDSLRWRLGVPTDRIVYVGDGSSDIHVMLHVNRGDGLTIAASETRHIAQIAETARAWGKEPVHCASSPGFQREHEREALPAEYRTHGSMYESHVPLVLHKAPARLWGFEFRHNRDLARWLYT